MNFHQECVSARRVRGAGTSIKSISGIGSRLRRGVGGGRVVRTWMKYGIAERIVRVDKMLF